MSNLEIEQPTSQTSGTRGLLYPNGQIRPLAEKVLSEIEQPKDHWEVTAHLEVSGIRDIDAQQDFGCADVFELAKRIMELAQEIKPARLHRPLKQAPLAWRFVKGYLKGLLFSMPMAAQIFAMILFGYSLWAWIDFSLRQATAIALGTITSFMVTGGFSQAIGRRGLFYIHQGEDILTKKVCYRFFLAGLATIVSVGLFLYLTNLVFEFLPWDMAFYAQFYYFFLSVLWLSFSILYMLRQQFLITLITVVGILFVHLVFLFTRWGMLTAHGLGLGTAVLLSLIAGWAILHRRAKRAEREYTGSELPRSSMLVYATASYFCYGVLYFTFLFSDRILAWTGATGRGFLPYFIWFNTPYELGMDWALFSFVLTVGVLEFTIQEFSDRIIPAEQVAPADRIGNFNRRVTRFYYTHLALFVAIAIFSVLGAYWGMVFLRQSGVFPFIEVFFNPITKLVFWWAAIGYVFMVWGLFNNIFFFALSRPGFVLRSLAPALLLNLVIGFILSRAFHYELAVVGLTVGSLAFMLISSFYARRAFKQMDYYYYAAY